MALKKCCPHSRGPAEFFRMDLPSPSDPSARIPALHAQETGSSWEPLAMLPTEGGGNWEGPVGQQPS